MHRVVNYAARLGNYLLGYVPAVRIERYPFHQGNHLANFGGRSLTFNLSRLGHRFFNECNQEEVDDLLIHEFAHHFSINHFDDAFFNACTRFGAKLRSCKDFL